MSSEVISEEREYLLSLVLDKFANDPSKISVFASEGSRIVLSKQILMLFSPVVTNLLSMIPPCQESALILPDFSASSILSIGDILENGFTTTCTSNNPGEVIEAAKALNIDMKNLESISDSLSNNDIMDMLGEKDNTEKENLITNDEVTTYDITSTDNPDPEEKLLEETEEFSIQIENSFSLADTDFTFSEVADETREVAVEKEQYTTEDSKTEIVIEDTCPTISECTINSAAVRKLDFNVEPTPEHNCKLCNEHVESVEALLYHYCFHFEEELQLKCSGIFDGKTCLKCQRTFESVDSVFILHFGLFHGKIIDILKEKEIGNFEISRGEIETETPRRDFQLDPNLKGDQFTCQVCKREGYASRVLMCYTLHWFKDVRAVVEPFIDGLKCKICDFKFGQKTNVVKHIGTTHGKVNILLEEKGIPIIPLKERGISKILSSGRRKPQRKPKTNLQQPDFANRVANAYHYLLSAAKVSKPVNQNVATQSITENKNIETVVLDDNDEDMKIVDKLMEQSTEFLIDTDPVKSLENTLSELFEERTTPSPTPSLVSLTSTNSERECEFCKKEVLRKSQLWAHYHGHFAATARRKFSDLMALSDLSNQCKLCDVVFKTEATLVSHISLTHQKLNEILVEKGIKPLTRRKNKTSEELAVVIPE